MILAPFLVLAAAAPAQRVPPRPLLLNPQYQESATGLSVPQLDGGITEIEMGDVNGDGNVDLVSVGDHGNPYIGTDQHGIIVWLGDGTGRWSVRQYGTFGYGGVALGDVNGDGLLDAGYGIHHNYSGIDLGDQILEVALGDGSGAYWTAWDDGLAGNGETYGMAGVDFGDFDNDGDLDLVANSFGCCSGIHVYSNLGNGAWVQSFGFTGGNSQESAVVGDVNGDGHADFAVGHQNGTVWLGDGQGGFSNGDANLPAGGLQGRGGVDLGDVNGDGFSDLSYVSSSGVAQVWLAEANGTWTKAGAGLPTSSSYQLTQLADVNSDGKTDLVAYGDRNLHVFLGDGSGAFRGVFQLQTPSPGSGEALRVHHDVDRNGYLDIALVDDEGSIFNSRNKLHFYKETSQPKVLWCEITAPGPNAAWRRGAVQFIDWVSAVPGTAPSAVDLEISLNGPAGPWLPVASGLPNNGRYQGVVPNVAAADARLRLTVRTATAAAQAVSRQRLRIL